MTRRIALAILLTVWAVLVAGCVVAYVTVRWAMIEQLDRSLIAKASAVPELARAPAGLATRPAPVPSTQPISVTPGGLGEAADERNAGNGGGRGPHVDR